MWVLDPPPAPPSPEHALPIGVTVVVNDVAGADRDSPGQAPDALNASARPSTEAVDAATPAAVELPTALDAAGGPADGPGVEDSAFKASIAAVEASVPLLSFAPISLVERVDPLLLTAAVSAGPLQPLHLPEFPASELEGPPEPGMDKTASPPPAEPVCPKAPANPPRVFRPDGTTLIPDYVEYRDARDRLWVWDGKTWTDKSGISVQAPNLC